MKTMVSTFAAIVLAAGISWAEDLGNLSANPFDVESSSNSFGKGSPFAPNGINNPFSPYGSPFSPKSATNPFATDAPRLYDQQAIIAANSAPTHTIQTRQATSSAAMALRSRRIR
jgi:hypothetical protein